MSDDTQVLEPHVTHHRVATLDDFEVRETSDGMAFDGHAAVFDSMSHDLGGFREVIDRGAFRKALANSPDVMMLWNHRFDQPLARTTVKRGAGSLKLSEDATGLHVSGTMVPTSTATDVAKLTRAKVVTGMSFGFRLASDPDVQTVTRETDGVLLRRIHEIDSLIDVSPVSDPAYPATGFQVRSVCGVELVPADLSAVRDLAWAIHQGAQAASAEDRAALDNYFQTMNTVSPWMAQRALQAVSREQELRGAIPGTTVTLTFTTAPDGAPDEDQGEQVAYRLAARLRRQAMAQRQIGAA